MRDGRTTGIPSGHIIAELAAFPLASQQSFELAASAIDPAMGGSSWGLWRAAERHLLGSFPGLSVDSALAMRDAIWFGMPSRSFDVWPGPPPTRRLDEYLLGSRAKGDGFASLTDRILEQYRQGGIDRHEPVAAGFAECVDRDRWRWLLRALPPDVLELVTPPSRRFPHPTTMSHQLAAQLADNGYAELHLHLGAALEFDAIWVTLHCNLRERSVGIAALQGPGADFSEGALLAPWLLRGAIGRLGVAAFLSTESGSTLRDFLDRVLLPYVRRSRGASDAVLLARSLDELRFGHLADAPTKESEAQVRSLYRALGGSVRRAPVNTRDALADLDPIAHLLPRGAHAVPWAERRLVAAAVNHLRQSPREDPLLAAIFWQTQRLRCIYYRHIVQRPLTPGLQSFIRHYRRLRSGRGAMSGMLEIRCAAEQAGLAHGLRSLEVRTSPPGKKRGHLKSLKAVAEGARELWARTGDRCELAVVLHLTKDRGGGADEGTSQAQWRGTHADPSSRHNAISRYRYSYYYRTKERETAVACWGLQARPEMVALIRGVDVCSDELGVPNWVLLPLVRQLRWVGDQETRRAWASAQQERPTSHPAALLTGGHRPIPATDEPPRILTTVHVGEDFIHLLTGLRNVDLAVRYFPLCEGDRIGHGMALGVAARDWCERTGRLMMPLEERLIDLVWAWSYTSRSQTMSRVVHCLEREIRALAIELFSSDPTPSADELAQLLDDLHDPETLGLIGYPSHHRRFPKEFRRFTLLHTYLTSTELFLRGRRIISVDAPEEAELVQDLQCSIRRELGARGIAVEINPSSNLIIGDLGDLTRHPLWRLHPPVPDADAPPVPVCIGSDDPVIFATSTREEYQLASDAIVASNRSTEDARAWIDQVRRTGLEYRFSLPVDIARQILDAAETGS